MTAADDSRWVPKVHPLTRLAEAEDPMELMAEPVIGDPGVMLECLLQEYIWMGWNSRQLLSLFHDPGYPMLCQLREYFGDADLQRRVEALLDRTGVLRFRETIAEPEDDGDHGHVDLVQLMLPSEQPSTFEQPFTPASPTRFLELD